MFGNTETRKMALRRQTSLVISNLGSSKMGRYLQDMKDGRIILAK
jgi:hypothetical protein